MLRLRAFAALVARSALVALGAGALAVETGCSEQARPGVAEPARTRLPGSASTASVPSAQDAAAAPDGTTAPNTVVDSATPAHDAGASPVGGAAPSPSAADSGPIRRRYVVAAVGDSLTDARSQGGKYLELLRERCPGSRFDNYGVGGEMCNQMRRRFARDVLGDPPVPEEPKPEYTHVIILGGINDICSDESARRSNRKLEADLSGMYGAARKHGIRVVALTMPPWGGFERYYNARRGASTLEVNDWIRGLGRDGAVDAVVDLYPLLSCGVPTKLCPRYAWPDQVHWNAEGHRVVGEALYRTVFADCE